MNKTIHGQLLCHYNLDKDKQRLKDKSNSARHKKRRSSSSAVRRLTQPIPLDPAGKQFYMANKEQVCFLKCKFVHSGRKHNSFKQG